MLVCSGMELWVHSLTFLLLICFFQITGTASESDKSLLCTPKFKTKSQTATTESETASASKNENFFDCIPGLESKGVTIPKGDIVIRHGSPLEIKCLLKPEHWGSINSSSLGFFVGDEKVSPEFVSVINETAIRLYIKNPPPSTTLYSCMRQYENGKEGVYEKGKEGVCINTVFVGYPPRGVQNFTCKSYNWQVLNCTWVPVQNYVKTCFELYYTDNTKKRKYFCPDDSEYHSESFSSCRWNASSIPVYRNVLSQLYFKMESWNALGKTSTNYEIEHFTIVIPNKPVNLKLVNATSNSLCISWDHPIDLQYFPPGLVSRVMYQSKWDSFNDWQLVNTSHLNPTDHNHTLNIAGLKYVHTVYDIRVLLKSSLAKDEAQWWSEPATITLHTKPTVPGMSPRTDIGSFEIENNSTSLRRNIDIYWQQIPEELENGDDFKYKVIRIEEFVNEKKIERTISPSKITKTFAKFTNLTSNAYRFVIVSANNEGYSSASVITVPSQDNQLKVPVTFTKIAHNDGVYEVSWSRPNDIRVNSYTIFWCENKQDRPYDCKGILNWTHVQNVTVKNLTLEEDKVYQFAISANSKNSSSGMLWAKCTVVPDQAGGRIKSTWIKKVDATFIEVNWTLDCFERLRIRGFVIQYCPTVRPENSSCKEPMQNKTINGETAVGGIITGLKPYKTYRVQVAINTTSLGMWSEPPLLTTTLEAAPDSGPKNLDILNTTNTTIHLSWKPPSFLNGLLRYYELHFNNSIIRMNKTDYTFTNLSSYTHYNISIAACTAGCSNKSWIPATTKIGNPSQLNAPRVSLNNSAGIMHISWRAPDIPGGPDVHYRVKVDFKDGLDEETRYCKELRETSCNLTIPEFKASINYKVFVRAKNVGEDNITEYYSPWSPHTEDSCYNPSAGMPVPNMALIVLLGVSAMIITCLAFAFVTRCAWLRFKAMQNVGVKLPPQLELNSVFKDKSVMDLPITAHVCSSSLKPHQHSAELLDESATPDQQLLLDSKLKDEGSCDSPCDELDIALETGSGEGHIESSGCGSGHDSVSSSITAGTHITDSGTEADERPPSPDVFSQSPRRLSDLRQRNITGGGTGGGGGSGEGYSRLAAAPTGYVTLPQGPRTYVSHAHLWSSHNGSLQQCHKGYVIAPPLTSTYSKVSLLPTTGLKVTSSRETCADAESGARSEAQLSTNPASSI